MSADEGRKHEPVGRYGEPLDPIVVRFFPNEVARARQDRKERDDASGNRNIAGRMQLQPDDPSREESIVFQADYYVKHERESIQGVRNGARGLTSAMIAAEILETDGFRGVLFQDIEEVLGHDIVIALAKAVMKDMGFTLEEARTLVQKYTVKRVEELEGGGTKAKPLGRRRRR